MKKIVISLISIVILFTIYIMDKDTSPNDLPALEPNHYLHLVEDEDGNSKYVDETALNYDLYYLQSLIATEIMTELHLNTQYGVDYTLFDKALSDKKEILEIEGFEVKEEFILNYEKHCPTLIINEVFIDKKTAKEDLIVAIETYANGTCIESYILTPNNYMTLKN